MMSTAQSVMTFVCSYDDMANRIVEKAAGRGIVSVAFQAVNASPRLSPKDMHVAVLLVVNEHAPTDPTQTLRTPLT